MYLVFRTEAEAQEAQAAIWDAIKPPAELQDGKPVKDRVTQRWAVPREAKEGWAIAVPPAPVKGIGGIEMAEVTFPEGGGL